PWRLFRSSSIRLDAKPVVHGDPELLFASEVALRGLDGDVPEEELDLIQFAAIKVAEARAGSPQVVRRQPVGARASRRRPDYIHQHLGRHAISPDTASLVDRAEPRALSDYRGRRPGVHRSLHPRWNRDRAYVARLSDEIGSDPVLLPLLDRLNA